MVRAHVEARSGHADRVGGYLTAATRYLEPHPPMVIAIGGLPGTGKSTLARALAPLLGCGARRTGAAQRRNPKTPARRRAGATPAAIGLHRGEERRRFSMNSRRLAETAARGGHAVIADATFMDLAHRSLIEAAAHAGRRAVPRHLVERAAADAGTADCGARTGDASDATVEVLRAAVGRRSRRRAPGMRWMRPMASARGRQC